MTAGLVRVEDGSGLVAAVDTIQRAAFMRFADVGQRAQQLPAPRLGAVTWLDSTRLFEYWDFGWKPLTADLSALEARMAATEARNTAQDGTLANHEARIAALEARPVGLTGVAGYANAVIGATPGRAIWPHGLGRVPGWVVCTPVQVGWGGEEADVVSLVAADGTNLDVRILTNRGNAVGAGLACPFYFACG